MIVQGQDFITPSSEVAAVVVDKKPYQDPMDAFYKADNYYNQWKVAKDREKALKQAQLAQEAKDFDFTTNGIVPQHSEFFINHKKDIANTYAELQGLNKNTPDYAQKNYLAKAKVQQLQTLANGSTETQKSNALQLKELIDNNTNYDIEKSKKAFAERSLLPVEEQIKLGNTSWLVPKGKDLNTLHNEIFKKDAPLANLEEKVIDKNGVRITIESRSFEKIMGVVNNQILTNEPYRNEIMNRFDALDDNVKAHWNKMAADKNVNPNGYSGSALYGANLAKEYEINNVKKIEDTEAGKANRDFQNYVRKDRYNTGKQEESYKGAVDNYIKLATGYGATMDETQKKLVQQEIMAQPIAKYPDADGKPVDIYATEFEYVLGDDGTMNYRFKPSKTGYMGTTEDQPYVTTTNIGVLLDDRYDKMFSAKGETNNWQNALQKAFQERGGGGKNNVKPTAEFEEKRVGKKQYKSKSLTGSKPTTEEKSVAKEVVKKGYNSKTNQTQFIYSDGTKEIVNGKQ